MEPLAALVAVAVLVTGLAAYGGALDTVVPAGESRDPATPTLRRAHDALLRGGALDPSSLPGLEDSAPPGFSRRVTITSADHAWTVGPSPPRRARGASAAVAVRVAPGRVRPGRLRVEVWS